MWTYYLKIIHIYQSIFLLNWDLQEQSIHAALLSPYKLRWNSKDRHAVKNFWEQMGSMCQNRAVT